MPFLVEKRSEGHDRRMNVSRSPFYGRERRVSDRRQLVVKEIPFREWALHLIHFQKRLEARRKRLQEIEAQPEVVEIDLENFDFRGER